MLKVDSLCCTRGNFSCCYNLSALCGSLTLISGENGGGKSTLFHLLAGFLSFDSGKITWQNRDIHNLAPASRGISILFQKNNLFPHLIVERNISLGVSLKGSLSSDEQSRVDFAIDFFGLNDFRNRLPESLSGGQVQRVALARCMLRRDKLLLLDEPLTSLDSKAKHQFIEILETYIAKQNLCVLLSSHELQLFSRLANSHYRIIAGKAEKIS